MKNRKVFSVVATAVISSALIAGVCTQTSALTTNATEKSQSSVICDNEIGYRICNEDMNMAQSIAGFELNLAIYSNYMLLAKRGTIMMQVPLDETRVFTVEKSINKTDFSAIDDYNYIKANDQRVSEINLVLGKKDGKVFRALWSNGKYNYVLSYSDGEEINNIIERVLEVNKCECNISSTDNMVNSFNSDFKDTSQGAEFNVII